MGREDTLLPSLPLRQLNWIQYLQISYQGNMRKHEVEVIEVEMEDRDGDPDVGGCRDREEDRTGGNGGYRPQRLGGRRLLQAGNNFPL